MSSHPSKQLRCDVCGDPAMVSILKDAFGKSDQMGNFCAVHAPKHSAIRLPEAPLTSKERSLAERLDRILRDPYVANRAMAQTILEARDALSGDSSAPENFARKPGDCGHERATIKCPDCGIDFIGKCTLPADETKEDEVYPGIADDNECLRDVLAEIRDHSTDPWAKGLARQQIGPDLPPSETSAQETKPKPTIDGLERLLHAEDPTPVYVWPDGTVHDAPSPPEKASAPVCGLCGKTGITEAVRTCCAEGRARDLACGRAENGKAQP